MRIKDVLKEYKENPQDGEDYEVLTLTEKNGFIRQKDRFNKRLALADTSKYKVIGRGDFAFNPYLLWAGAIAENSDFDRGIISPLYPTFRVNPGYDSAYVRNMLLSPQMIAAYDTISFGSVPRKRRASVENFMNLPLGESLPPLEEQKRIAGILEVSARQLGYVRLQIDKTFELMRFEEIPESSGRTIRLGDIFTIRSGQINPKLERFKDVLHVAPDSMVSGMPEFVEVHTCAEDGVTSGKYEFFAGDVLYSKIRPYLNKVAIPKFDGVCSADMYALVPHKGYTAEFVQAVLMSPKFLSYAESVSGRASIPKINRKSLEAFTLAEPSGEEVRCLTERVGRASAQVEILKEKLTLLQELHRSLTTRAFTGEL